MNSIKTQEHTLHFWNLQPAVRQAENEPKQMNKKCCHLRASLWCFNVIHLDKDFMQPVEIKSEDQYNEILKGRLFWSCDGGQQDCIQRTKLVE